MSAGAGEALRGLCGGWSAGKLTPGATATARMGILDAVGCIVAGVPEAPSRITRELAAAQGGSAESSVLGTDVRLPAPLAAMVNGVSGHVLDYDDMSVAILGHPSVVLVPTLFALAERGAGSGADILSAYVLGFEVDAFFGRIMVPRHYEAGWHATSSIGIFGATAAACHLMRLDADATVNALAIAASGAAGLRSNFGSMTKALHAGAAAEGAVRAAALSARGFTGNPDVFGSGPHGFFRMYGANDAAAGAKPGLEIEAAGIGLKPYPCCGAGVTLVDAALELHAGGVRAADIETIDCAVTPMAAAIMRYENAEDALQARYCLRYCAAVALADGRAGLPQFTQARVRALDVQALMERVRVRTDAALASGDGRFGVAITARLRDGSSRSARLDLPLGHPRRALGREQRLAKFVECAAPVAGEQRAREAANLLEELETLPSLAPVTRLLCNRLH